MKPDSPERIESQYVTKIKMAIKSILNFDTKDKFIIYSSIIKSQDSIINEIETLSSSLFQIEWNIKKWNQHVVFIEELSSQQNDPIEIRLKGELFRSTKSTLIKCDWFKPLFKRWENKNGILITSRDPKLFEIILNYLRSDNWDLNDLDATKNDEFINELEFFAITIPKSQLESKIKIEKDVNRLKAIALDQNILLEKEKSLKESQIIFVKEMLSNFPILSKKNWNFQNDLKTFKGLTLDEKGYIVRMYDLI